MKKRIFAIALIMLITLSLFVPISVSAETGDNKIYVYGELLPSLIPLEKNNFEHWAVIERSDGRIQALFSPEIDTDDTNIPGEVNGNSEYCLYNLIDGSWQYNDSSTGNGVALANSIAIWTNIDIYDYTGSHLMYSATEEDVYYNTEKPDTDNTITSVATYVFYPDRIDKKISGVEDIILGIYENDTMPRPSEDGYTVIFQNNGTFFIASASQPFRKYSGSSSIMLADQSTFDYWAIDGAMIQYLGKTASFTPVNWIAGTHDVLNWNDNSVYQSFENIGNVAFPKTPPTQTQTLPSVVGAKMLAGVTTEMIAILPCLIVLLMGYLALRKALAILQQILHQA